VAAYKPGFFYFKCLIFQYRHTLHIMKIFRLLLWSQATYIVITAVWPIIHIDSFMAVTGYKHDVWLVKTVGALLIPVAVTLYIHLFINTDHRPAVVLGSLTALAFIIVDFYYALNDVISDIYLADGIAELIFLIVWIYVFTGRRHVPSAPPSASVKPSGK
jgi:hypothetical protein